MTTKEIANRINSNENFLHWHGLPKVKGWENYGKSRIYVGDEFIDLTTGKAVAVRTPARKGFYERNSDYIDRLDANAQLTTPLHIIARYINLINK